MEAQKGNGEKLILKVKKEDGESKCYIMEHNTPFRELMNIYKRDNPALRFTFDGTQIKETDTPGSMNMEDNDITEVHYHQSPISLAMKRELLEEVTETVAKKRKVETIQSEDQVSKSILESSIEANTTLNDRNKYLEKYIQFLEKSNAQANAELAKIKQDLQNLHVEVESKNSKIQALEESNGKAQK